MPHGAHLRDVLFRGEKPFPILPAVDHYAGNEKLWLKALDLQVKLGKSAEARTYYETYLAKAPTADDRWLVEASLKKINGSTAS